MVGLRNVVSSHSPLIAVLKTESRERKRGKMKETSEKIRYQRDSRAILERN